MIQPLLTRAVEDLRQLLPAVEALHPPLQRLGDTMIECWARGGKVLVCGNGGSAADAMHFAEELVARFQKNRKALAAIALCDPAVLTCAANDFGYESVFARQVEALGNRGDVLILMTTSGNSPNLVKALEVGESRGLVTAGFLGKDGGVLRGRCAIELLVAHPASHRVQEAHKLLYHTLCEWIDSKF